MTIVYENGVWYLDGEVATGEIYHDEQEGELFVNGVWYDIETGLAFLDVNYDGTYSVD